MEPNRQGTYDGYSRGADRGGQSLLDQVMTSTRTSVVGDDGDVRRFVAGLLGAAPVANVEIVETGVGADPGSGGDDVHLVVIGPDAVAELLVVIATDGTPTTFRRSVSTDRAGRRSPRPPAAGPYGTDLEPIEVAVLGPLQVRGVEIAICNRPLLAELVVYLALHPEGVATRTWSAALWPDRFVPAQTVSNRLSEARRLLGFAPDGRPRMRREGDRHLIADVTTDWDRFRLLASDEDDPEAWREALGLVRGRPFVDLAQGQWALLEGITGEIEGCVVECGLALGRRLLAEGDPDGAAWACQMALRCAPWDERLHRLLMRAADAAGNRPGIEAALRHLALVLEIDGDPLGSVHPQTAALYSRLARRESAPS